MGKGQKTPIGVTQGCGVKLLAPKQEGPPDIRSKRHEISLYQKIGSPHSQTPALYQISIFKFEIATKKRRGTACRAPSAK
jgi:hypothetical protein